MPSPRSVSLLVLFLLGIPVWAQQTQTATPPPPAPPAAQDPQAINVVNQAIAAAGGAQAILAINDYTAIGNITYEEADGDIQGSVKVLGSGFANFRLDATLPSGVRSESVSQGNNMIGMNGVAGRVHAQPPMNPSRYLLPILQLRPVVNSRAYRVTYVGLVQVNGHSTHDIQIQRAQSVNASTNELLRQYTTIDFFIDATSYQVVMMQDIVFRSLTQHSLRQIQYVDYRSQGGVLVPFSISEQLDGAQIRQIQLNTISFNSGLQNSDFDIAQSTPTN